MSPPTSPELSPSSDPPDLSALDISEKSKSTIQKSPQPSDNLTIDFLPLTAGTRLPPRTGTPLSDAQAKQMFAELEAIFQQAEDAEGGVGVRELSDRVDYGDYEETINGRKNVAALRNARSILDQMWWSDSDYLVRAAEVLADASREPEWREPYGEAHILEFFLEIMKTERIAQDLQFHSLRLIGNSCADTDSNRQRVIDNGATPRLAQLVDFPSLAKVAVPVLYNICVDYEPAKIQVAVAGATAKVFALLSGPHHCLFETPILLSYCCRLLDQLTTLENGTDNSPDDAVDILLRLAAEADVDVEDYVSLISCAVTHLHDDRFQHRILSTASLQLPLSILVDSYSRFEPSEEETLPALSNLELTTPTLSPSATNSPTGDPLLLPQTRSALLSILTDISALPEFSQIYDLHSALIGSLRIWLSVPQAQLKACAALMLGNVARSDDVCLTMVQRWGVEGPLVDTLETASDSQLLHATLGFLKNLALPAENKLALGEADLIRVLSRLWAMETLPQIQYASASLTRQLIANTYPNIVHLLSSLSPDPDSPANARTYLSILLSLYEKSDQLPTQTEVARLVTAICRTLNTLGDRGAETQERLYGLHPTIARPLTTMVCQDQWPVVRSEGWFAFALMARSKTGASAVSEAMDGLELAKSLVETVTGRKLGEASPGGGEDESPAEGESKEQIMKRKDRENVMILISELLRHKGDEMSPMRRQTLVELLQGKEPAALSELLTSGGFM